MGIPNAASIAGLIVKYHPEGEAGALRDAKRFRDTLRSATSWDSEYKVLSAFASKWFCGLEWTDSGVCKHPWDKGFYYMNTGDPYNPTLLIRPQIWKLDIYISIGCWGDIIERFERAGRSYQ